MAGRRCTLNAAGPVTGAAGLCHPCCPTWIPSSWTVGTPTKTVAHVAGRVLPMYLDHPPPPSKPSRQAKIREAPPSRPSRQAKPTPPPSLEAFPASLLGAQPPHESLPGKPSREYPPPSSLAVKASRWAHPRSELAGKPLSAPPPPRSLPASNKQLHARPASPSRRWSHATRARFRATGAACARPGHASSNLARRLIIGATLCPADSY